MALVAFLPKFVAICLLTAAAAQALEEPGAPVVPVFITIASACLDRVAQIDFRFIKVSWLSTCSHAIFTRFLVNFADKRFVEPKALIVTETRLNQTPNQPNKPTN